MLTLCVKTSNVLVELYHFPEYPSFSLLLFPTLSANIFHKTSTFPYSANYSLVVLREV